MKLRYAGLMLWLGLLSTQLLHAGSLPEVPPAPVYPNGPVTAAIIDQQEIYVAGGFSAVTYRCQAQGFCTDTVLGVGSLIANDLRSGAIKSAANLERWKSPVLIDESVVINTLEVDHNRGWLIVGGSFQTFGGLARNGLAAIRLDTGALVASWNPSTGNSSSEPVTVNDLEWSADGQTLYVAGNFIRFAGLPRQHLAAVDMSDGSVTAWNPQPDGPVHVLARDADGATLYAGGSFGVIGGQQRRLLASITLYNQGLAQAWEPQLAGTAVYALLRDGNRLYVGGQFTTPRNNLAAFDLTTHALLPWNPDINGRINTLALNGDGSRLFAGGSYTQVGGQSRNNLAMISTADAVLQAWDPSASMTGGEVKQLLFHKMNYFAAPIFNADEYLDHLLVMGSFFGVGAPVPNSLDYYQGYMLEPPKTVASPLTGAFQSAAWNNGQIALSCTSYTGGICAKISYSLDEGVSFQDYAGPISACGVSPCTQHLRYRGIDVEGNSEALHDEVFVRDDEPPVTVADPHGLAMGVKNYQPIALNCTDSGDAGCDKIYYTVDGSEPTLPPGATQKLYDQAIDLGGDQVYTLKFMAVDKAGNAEIPHSEIYTIDRVPPEVIVAPGAGVYSAPITVELRCADCQQVNGLPRIYYTVDGTAPFDPLTMDSLTPQPSDTAIPYTTPILISNATLLRLMSYDDVGNVTEGMGGIYTFIDTQPERRVGFGAASEGMLALLAAAVVMLRRRRLPA